MTENKEITGIIQNLKEKSLAINNDWYNSFTALKDLNKGDNVKVTYTVNTKNDKSFNNIKKVEKLETPKEVKPQFKSNHGIDTSTLNTLIMTIKDLQIAHIEHYEIIPELSKTTDEVLEMYNKIKSLT